MLLINKISYSLLSAQNIPTYYVAPSSPSYFSAILPAHINLLARALKKSLPKKLKPTLIPVVAKVRAKTPASCNLAGTLSSEVQ